MPVLLVVAALALERVLVLCRLRGRCARRCLARAGGEIRPGLRLRQALGAPAFRSASKSAATAPACRCLSQTAGQAATQAPVTAQARRNPGRGAGLRSEIADRGIHRAGNDLRSRPATPSMTVNWRTARASVVGLPAVPQRASIVFDDPSIDRVNGSVQAPLARAKHIELHGRLAEGSAARSSRDRNRVADRTAAACRRCIRCWRSRSMPTCAPC